MLKLVDSYLSAAPINMSPTGLGLQTYSKMGFSGAHIHLSTSTEPKWLIRAIEHICQAVTHLLKGVWRPRGGWCGRLLLLFCCDFVLFIHFILVIWTNKYTLMSHQTTFPFLKQPGQKWQRCLLKCWFDDIFNSNELQFLAAGLTAVTSFHMPVKSSLVLSLGAQRCFII